MKHLIIFFLASLILSCGSPEARKPVSKKSGSFIKESAERNIKLNERERAAILEIIEADSLNEYIASENGFWYSYNTRSEIDSISAEFGDILNFDYRIEDMKGNEIYSESELKTRNYAMDQEELFTGLREGLKLMHPGETVTFLFPSQKAYGYYGDSNRIGSNLPLKVKVTLNSITKNED
ncbi:MAG: gliding motility-associated peptidyl-prolyl isomerase GldI [Flavobacteriaceae bacterium]|nr:gliding motility-associated peptidyl-prolyl isomerase GldI [Flavobacteriaceae bacterium]